MMKRLKELEAENGKLKKMYAEERLKSELRKEALKNGVTTVPTGCLQDLYAVVSVESCDYEPDPVCQNEWP